MRPTLRSRSTSDMPIPVEDIKDEPPEVVMEIVPEDETIILIDDEEVYTEPPKASRNPFMNPLRVSGKRLKL